MSVPLAVGDFFPAQQADPRLARSQIAVLFTDLARELDRRFKEDVPEPLPNQQLFHDLTQQALRTLRERAKNGVELSDGHDAADFQRRVRVKKIEQGLRHGDTDPLSAIASMLGLKNWNALLLVHKLEAMEAAADTLAVDIHLGDQQPSLHDALLTYQHASFAHDAKIAFKGLLAVADDTSEYAALILRARSLSKADTRPDVAARDAGYAFFKEFTLAELPPVATKNFGDLFKAADQFYIGLGRYIDNQNQVSEPVGRLLKERAHDLPGLYAPAVVEPVIVAPEQAATGLNIFPPLPPAVEGGQALGNLLGIPFKAIIHPEHPTAH